MTNNTVTYEQIVYQIGKLHSLLRQANGRYQGEHTIAYGAPGAETTLRVYIDEAFFEMTSEPGNLTGLSGSTTAESE